MNKIFLKDVGSNYVIYGAQLGLGLVAIPVYLDVYGEDLYGVYLLSIGMAASMLALEFGSGRSIVRYVAEFGQDSEELKYGLALKTCGVLSLIASFLSMSVFTVLAYNVDRIFHVPQHLEDEAFWLLIGAGGYSVLLFISQLTTGVLKGAGIFYERNKLALWQIAVQVVVLGYIYFLRPTVYVLLLGTVVQLLISLFFDVYIIRRKSAKFLRFDLLKQHSLRSLWTGEVWGYSKNTFYLSGVAFFSQNVDKLLLGLFLDVRFVAIYAILVKPYQTIKSLLGKAYSVFQPHYVRIQQTHGSVPLLQFVLAGGRLITAASIIAIGALILLLPSLYHLWLGTDKYDQYLIYGQLLLAATIVRSLTTMLYRAMYLTGYAKALLNIEATLVGLNLLASLLLVNVIGVGGVIVGTLLQLVLVVPFISIKSRSLTVPSQDGRLSDRTMMNYVQVVAVCISLILVSFFAEKYMYDYAYLMMLLMLGVVVVMIGAFYMMGRRKLVADYRTVAQGLQNNQTA